MEVLDNLDSCGKRYLYVILFHNITVLILMIHCNNKEQQDMAFPLLLFLMLF